MRSEIAEGDGEAKELKAKIATLEKQMKKDKTAGSDADVNNLYIQHALFAIRFEKYIIINDLLFVVSG